MKWKNALKDQLPQGGEEVLISVDGVYYIAVYMEGQKKFNVNDDLKSNFHLDKHVIYWTEFQD